MDELLSIHINLGCIFEQKRPESSGRVIKNAVWGAFQGLQNDPKVVEGSPKNRFSGRGWEANVSENNGRVIKNRVSGIRIRQLPEPAEPAEPPELPETT